MLLQTFGTITDQDHHPSFEKRGCGHGGQPPCTIPLDGGIYFLIAFAIIIGAFKIKKHKPSLQK